MERCQDLLFQKTPASDSLSRSWSSTILFHRTTLREVIKVNTRECISERIVEQTVEPAQSVGEARPPEIAKHSASTQPDLAVFSGEDGL